jgi:FkbM family methyltransferase
MKLSETYQPTQPVEMIQTKYGWMFCPPGDHYVTGSLKRWGVYSECEAMLLGQLCANRTVLLAGGHIGAIAIPVARYAEAVTAYEPQPLLALLCKANASSCKLGHKIYVENAALGTEAGHINVPVLRLDANYNTGRLGKADWGQGARIRMDNLQRLLEDTSYNFMLLDVEGMEYELLDGCRGKWPDMMWLECDRPDGGKLIQMLNDEGREAYWIITPLTPNQMPPDNGPWPLQCSFNLLVLRRGADWPLPGVAQFLATPSDSMATTTSEKIIWSLTESK